MILKWKVLADVGNYIWGRGMAELGFELCDARIGTHVQMLYLEELDKQTLTTLAKERMMDIPY